MIIGVGLVGLVGGLLGGYFIGLCSFADIPVELVQDVVQDAQVIDVDTILDKYRMARSQARAHVRTIAELKTMNLNLTKQNEEFIVNGLKVMEVVDDQKVEIDTLKNLVTQFEAKIDSQNKSIKQMTEILDDYKENFIKLTDWKQRAIEHMKIQKENLKGLKTTNSNLMKEMKIVKEQLLALKKD